MIGYKLSLKVNKWIWTLLIIMITVIVSGKALAETASQDHYLSDLEWISATHGDADTGKIVQKNKPFSPGNNGLDTKISLKMADDSIKVFDKGLGTIASNPSTISYNITGAEVSHFSAYLGVDRSANATDPRYAHVEKFEIVVDGNVLYTTITDYPAGIGRDVAGIEVNLEIPADAKLFELKSYAGEQTWGDEAVFADALFKATGEFPSVTETASQDHYLSDLEWISATHGDADTGKIVQKNKPFSTGNNGLDTKISLKMTDDNIKVFEKGLGTIASNPSTISYNITGAEVSHFSAYLGVDRSANAIDPRYAHVEKFEIVVDGNVLYTTITDYPAGVGRDVAGIEVNLEIPADAKLFELKSYAGEQTWGDEAVFADALFKATGKFPPAEEIPDDWVPGEKRREISNEQPLLMMPLYAHGPKYEAGEYAFWGDDTLIEKWEGIPDELKPFSVMELHPDDLPKNATSAADFYEHYLEIAQNYVNPKTNKNEPIPIVLTVYTAGNLPQYTAAHWLTPEWIDEMYAKYSSLHGLFSTENYWIWTNTVEINAAEYLKLSAKHGGYFIWSEQNNGASIERALGSKGVTVFKNTLEKYWENFIFMYKNTPAAGGEDAPTSSYMTGLWLTDYAYQWGGLMDTWKWYETGKWRLFENSGIGQSQGNRQWLTEPEAMVGIEALNIYLNGGSVYNFEHPAYTYGVKNEKSPLYENVIEQFFKYIVAHPAPSKEEMRSKTKVLLHDDFSKLGGGNFFVGLNTELAQSPLYTTGRYGNIPAVPTAIERGKVEQALAGTDIDVIDSRQTDLATLAGRQNVFNNLYPATYKGDIFAQNIDQRWFVYNYKYNENIIQTGKDMILAGTAEAGKEWTVDVTIEPHTYLFLEGANNKLNVNLNNYRVNKDELWAGANTANEARLLPQWSKQTAIDWIHSNYINQTKDQENRTSTIVVRGLRSEPRIENVTGLEGNFEMPLVEYDAASQSAIVTITNNGYINFDLVCQDEIDVPIETIDVAANH